MGRSFPVLRTSKVLLACSGGVDSMALAHLFLECKMDFDLAHCNFKLREEASDADEEFVKAWGSAHGKSVFTKAFDLSRESGSVQVKARELRYQWFSRLLEEHPYDCIATAHHLNDSLETFLINLSRGTGLEGLTGIPEGRQRIIRPLLPFTRLEILDYAESKKMSWREDSSNLDTKYLRNKIRHEIVPQLEALHPSFLANFNKTQRYLADTHALLMEYRTLLKTQLFKVEGDTVHISLEKLRSLEPRAGYLYVLFQEYGFTQWEDMEHLLEATPGKEISSHTHRLIRDRDVLTLVPLKAPLSDIFLLHEGQTQLDHPVKLRIETTTTMDSFSKKSLYVDKEKLNYPLKIRKWEIGDYFYPLGMEGRKKLSKFFKDEKVGTLAKEEQWLLFSADELVWVIGRRPDKRFKVTEETKEIVKITLV